MSPPIPTRLIPSSLTKESISKLKARVLQGTLHMKAMKLAVVVQTETTLMEILVMTTIFNSKKHWSTQDDRQL